jgi:hypothetical protein
VHAHDQAVGEIRQHGGDPLAHRGAGRDDHVGPPRGPVHDPRLSRHGQAQPGVKRGRLRGSQEVQRVGEQGPPLAARRHEPDVVQRYPPASPYRAGLAGRQPGRGEPAAGADHLDIMAGVPLKIAAQLRAVPSRSA